MSGTESPGERDKRRSFLSRLAKPRSNTVQIHDRSPSNSPSSSSPSSQRSSVNTKGKLDHSQYESCFKIVSIRSLIFLYYYFFGIVIFINKQKLTNYL